MLWRARLDALGTLKHAIVCGIERGKIVNNDQDRDNFLSRLGTLTKEMGTGIYALVLLKKHSHNLLRSGCSGSTNTDAAVRSQRKGRLAYIG